MKEFTIQKNDAGQRLDRWLNKTLPLLPAAFRGQIPLPFSRLAAAQGGKKIHKILFKL